MAEVATPKLSEKRERQLQSNLRELSVIQGNLRALERSMCTVYFTSSFNQEGKTTAVIDAAYGLAEFGESKVLLVDANCSSPKLHGAFNVALGPGLHELLDRSVSSEEVVVPTAYEKLHLLTAGEGECVLFGTDFEDYLNKWRSVYDFVLIDGKSLFSASVAANMAPLVDGFMLVVKCEATKWEVAQLSHEKLVQSGAKHVGVVLNQRKFYLPRSIYRLLSKS